MDIGRLLRTEDPVERELLFAVHKEGVKVLDDVLTNLARKIVAEYAEAKAKGAKKDKKG